MTIRKSLLPGVCLAATSAAIVVPAARAQSCASGQNAAVECFVGNAVRTNLVTLQYGMTMAQFKQYMVLAGSRQRDERQ
ncbi:MAG: hypothetical protein WA224_11240 [Candidatus Acidiferrales bacterium]